MDAGRGNSRHTQTAEEVMYMLAGPAACTGRRHGLTMTRFLHGAARTRTASC
jgi:hypothetical protein